MLNCGKHMGQNVALHWQFHSLLYIYWKEINAHTIVFNEAVFLFANKSQLQSRFSFARCDMALYLCVSERKCAHKKIPNQSGYFFREENKAAFCKIIYELRLEQI